MFIEKVGNLELHYEYLPDLLCFGDLQMAVYATDGARVVIREVFDGAGLQQARRNAERLLNMLDVYTLADIRAGLPEISTEDNGRLLYGKIAGFDTTEYFQQIGSSRFYKHFTSRPEA